MPAGIYRRVFVIGRIAIKLPRLRHFLDGLSSNRWEREMWRTWRPFFRWGTLCPVIFGDPTGLLLVMARAHQPVAVEDIQNLPDAYPGITAETKPADYGRFAERVVAVDYGLPHDLARRHREYYRSFVTEGRTHYNAEEKDA